MNGTTRARGSLPFMLAVLMAGCSSPHQQQLPVSLPDLSRAATPVKDQLGERYTSLTRKINGAATPSVELGNEYGETGKLLMAAEYRDAAEPFFLNAQALVPGDARWPYYLAHLYRLRNEPEKSAMCFERALRLRPDHVAALVWLGGLHLLQGRPEAAEPLFTKALSLQPRLAAGLLGMGRAALARRDYAPAVKYLEEALAQDRLATIIHYPLATAYRGLGEAEKAEAHLRQRGHVDPDLPDPLMAELNGSLRSAVTYERLGLDALDKKEWARAAEYFGKGVELAPDNPSLGHRLGTALFLNGDASGAMNQFENVVRRSPGFAKARYSLGVLLITSGRAHEAIEQLSAAVKDDPNYLEARLRLADALRRSGRLAESLSQYEEVSRIDPHVAEAQFGFAMTLVRLRRYQEARDRLVEGMRANPTQPAFARALARVLAAAPDDRVRDGRQALAMTDRLLKEQQTLDLGETMAMTLAELGHYEQAATLQREVMAAVRKAGREDVLRQLRVNLERYQRHEPCRSPLRPDDPVDAFEAGVEPGYSEANRQF
ncbi:MAG: tetratricopeptide repeat protein [Acidobacteriota bacterium]